LFCGSVAFVAAFSRAKDRAFRGGQ